MRTRTMILSILASVLFATVLVVGLVAVTPRADRFSDRPIVTGEPVGGGGVRTGGGADHDLLHQDSTMTQYMSRPDARGPMFDGRMPDGQLERSRDHGYLRQLEQHQEDMDRMLARGRP